MKKMIKKIEIALVLYGSAFGVGIGNEGIKNVSSAILYLSVLFLLIIIGGKTVKMDPKIPTWLAFLPFVLFYHGYMLLGGMWVVVLIMLTSGQTQEKEESYFDRISKQ